MSFIAALDEVVLKQLEFQINQKLENKSFGKLYGYYWKSVVIVVLLLISLGLLGKNVAQDNNVRVFKEVAHFLNYQPVVLATLVFFILVVIGLIGSQSYLIYHDDNTNKYVLTLIEDELIKRNDEEEGKASKNWGHIKRIRRGHRV
ncbi:hypothetical protein [Levilactobacillus sp. N40-8-2]|mgnify:CR=1 FL=1|uniref:hypothetical protein n=1 Tax=Levilactobacillus muriae TaxID=3238987 RepID=UPI0038B2A572